MPSTFLVQILTISSITPFEGYFLLQILNPAKYARMLRATLNPLRRVTIISCRMVLDISSFRAEEGGSPDAMRKLQQDRFKVGFFNYQRYISDFQNVEVVQKIVDIDNQWRKEQFVLERTKFVKNLCSKTIGKKMKAKEPKGDTADLEEGA